MHLPLPSLALVRRRILQYPRLASLIAIWLAISLPYLILRHIHHGKHGRWYWNYAAALHPALIYVVPSGNWGPIERPPRWVQEIYDAPWMGDWEIPELSAPVYRQGPATAAKEEHANLFNVSDPSRDLVSPVIVKIHVFSTVRSEAREKRFLIRRLSPLLNIPLPYRHLIELKFVLGHAYKPNWDVDEEMEALLTEEQETYGDLLRLNLVHGENLREGKILDWIHAVGSGNDGGREALWLFKVDDDAVLNLPVFLDTLLELDPHLPHYLGTSLNRWPAYHHHFTGMVTGFSWGLVKTLSSGIGSMTRQEIETWWDDDVLTGELMFCLPPAPHCREPNRSSLSLHHSTEESLPEYCDPRAPPPWGWLAPPPSPDPRTNLIRYDFLRRMGDEVIWFIKGDVARHSWWFKFLERYEKEWKTRIKGKMWTPPKWLERYVDRNAG
ncbi:hypothetical protein BCR39DRAFT_588985 [Naematelia encephala]|uniref:Hexosyltransferase n=1 Tax=Naematelia encephala TaxID=71784 RepID=A0A1Y2B1E4_9TREE|nr:hypothetical protein BCR39DRAFT_588985 [Naematelia encephala]